MAKQQITSASTKCLPTVTPWQPPANRAKGVIAAVGILAIATYLGSIFGGRHAALFVVGCCAGLILYHSMFGFTSSWREFLIHRRGEGLRAQMLMLAIACLAFFPLLDAGSVFGQPLRGFIAPVGVSVVVGAFLFGVGMQLGGGCASGTLYTVGGGNTRMLIALAAFIMGAFIGTNHSQWWGSTPAFPPFSLLTSFGLPAALLITFALFGTVTAVTLIVERGGNATPTAATSRQYRWLRGPWPLLIGAVGLAMVNIATLLLAGRPWGVVGAFSLWGAKTMASLGVPVSTWAAWSTPAQKAALEGPLLADVTSIMDIGIALGALLAAILAGKFAPVWKIPSKSLLAAILGGLLLGYGARIAYGCNIGAFFSGIASGSMHGWVWFAAALAGNALGTRLRPLFGFAAR